MCVLMHVTAVHGEKGKTMREKLIELLEEAEGLVNNDEPSLEQIADHLISHGVTIQDREIDFDYEAEVELMR